MAYFKMITATDTWTVPATADYQIICVAGGNGAGTSAAPGGDTSFGSYCTSSGQWGSKCGGYTLIDYAVPNQLGVGYGAGGTYSNSGEPWSAACGKLAMATVSLSAGAVVTCTIGAGGTAGSGTGYTNGNGGVICIRQVG